MNKMSSFTPRENHDDEIAATILVTKREWHDLRSEVERLRIENERLDRTAAELRQALVVQERQWLAAVGVGKEAS